MSNLIKKLLYRSNHRGTKEMDLLIGGFAIENLKKLNPKELKEFEGKINKILAGDKKKKVDAHSFIEYITSKDLAGYLSSLKPKPTKKKPLSFERLSMIIIPIFKYFEDEKVFKSDNARILKTLDLWLNFVKS